MAFKHDRVKSLGEPASCGDLNCHRIGLGRDWADSVARDSAPWDRVSVQIGLIRIRLCHLLINNVNHNRIGGQPGRGMQRLA